MDCIKTTDLSIFKETEERIHLYIYCGFGVSGVSEYKKDIWNPAFPGEPRWKLIKIMLFHMLLNFKMDFLENCGMKFDSAASAVSINAIAMRQCSATKMGHSGSFRLFDFSRPNFYAQITRSRKSRK